MESSLLNIFEFQPLTQPSVTSPDPFPSDFHLDFSSPTTDIDNPPPPPPPPSTTSHSTHPFSTTLPPHLDALLPAPIQVPITSLIPTPQSLPKLEPVPASPVPSVSLPQSPSRKRPLAQMRALAAKHAPRASLSDHDLMRIGAMHESETKLASSRDLYDAFVVFKTALVRHGYSMSSIYVDKVTPSTDISRPFAFVLNKKGPLPEGSSESSAERPKKRQRTSTKGESDSMGRRYACVVCSKKMADVGNLIRHFRNTHQEEKPFTCPKCTGRYSSEGTLWHHISNVHTEVSRLHKCEYCDASYDSFGAKTRHIHGTHHTEKPLYPCPFKGCARTFVFPAHLEAHALEEHDGFRPFNCEECGRRFASANGLIRHRREVHRRGKAYTCPICQTGLTKRCHLKRHLVNVHQMNPVDVEEEMKKHPNPADIPSDVVPRYMTKPST